MLENEAQEYIHYTEIGCVSICESCYAVTLAIKDCCIKIPFNDFKSLVNYVLNFDESIFNTEHHILLKVPSHYIFFRLDKQNFEEVKELFNVSKIILQTKFQLGIL